MLEIFFSITVFTMIYRVTVYTFIFISFIIIYRIIIFYMSSATRFLIMFFSHTFFNCIKSTVDLTALACFFPSFNCAMMVKKKDIFDQAEHV